MIERVLRPICIVLLALVCLELLLQILSFGVYAASRRSGGPENADARTVLCLGDSFTYGFGATNGETSYPGRLEAKLNSRTDETWKVVNVGFPGKNSAEMLSALDYHLENLKPEFVILLAGANDTWSRPDRIETLPLGPQDSTQFRWRFRTLRLLKTLRRKDAFVSAHQDAPADEAIPPYPHPLPTDLSKEEVSLRLETFRLSTLGNRSFQKGNFAEATSYYEQIRDEQKANRIGALIPVQIALGNRSGAEELVAELLAYGKSPTIPEREAAIVAKTITNSAIFEQGNDTINHLAKRFPNNFTIALNQALCLQNLNRQEEARTASDRAEALRILPENDDHWASGWFLRTRSGLVRGFDLEEETRCQATAFLVDNDRPLTVKTLTYHPDIDATTWNRIVDGLPASEEQKSDLRAMLAEARLPPASTPDIDIQEEDTMAKAIITLGHHLGLITSRSRATGAKVLISTYPFLDHSLRSAQSKVAESQSIPLVDCYQAIQKAAKKNAMPRDDFFIPDGHCNDSGYEVMAEEIFQAMVPLLAR